MGSKSTPKNDYMVKTTEVQDRKNQEMLFEIQTRKITRSTIGDWINLIMLALKQPL